MSTTNTTNYFDENGHRVTIEKSFDTDLQLETETKSLNGNLVSQTTTKNGEMVSISYYVYSIEQLTEMLQQNSSISFIYKQFQNTYTINEYLTYENGMLTGKMISVENLKGQIVCFRKYQIVNGNLISHFTEKSYYENDVEKYAFSYNPDGTCFMVDSVQTYQEDIYGWEIGTSTTNFTWQGLEYYQFDDPMVPE